MFHLLSERRHSAPQGRTEPLSTPQYPTARLHFLPYLFCRVPPPPGAGAPLLLQFADLGLFVHTSRGFGGRGDMTVARKRPPKAVETNAGGGGP